MSGCFLKCSLIFYPFQLLCKHLKYILPKRMLMEVAYSWLGVASSGGRQHMGGGYNVLHEHSQVHIGFHQIRESG